MSKFLTDRLKNLTPYTPGEQPQNKKYVKLNTNENPYPPAPAVIEAIKDVANGDLRLYPDPTCRELSHVLAEYFDVAPENVFLGNGSDEVLGFAFQAFFQDKKKVLFPDITYSFYPVYSNLFNTAYETVPLLDDFTLDIDRFCGENEGVIFPNPNAPTAIGVPLTTVRKIIEANRDKVVIVDEAYIDYGGESAISLTKEYDNLMVVQTLSKSRSLAGLRVGFAIAHKDLIADLNTVKNSFNSYTMDRLALAGTIAAFKSDAYYDECTEKIIKTREASVKELEKLGFSTYVSHANFIFITHKTMEAETIYLRLKEEGVLVRYFGKPERIKNYLRVTVGTNEEMGCLIDTLKKILM